MQLKLILARAANGVIGRNNTIPWHLSEDLAHFKRLTLGHAVIMGRSTWDSLPERFRPLPGRRNIVLTRHAGWQATGVQRACSLSEALSFCEHETQAWVIGGAQLYALALPLAQQAEVTEIEQSIEGDTYAPTFAAPWVETARERHVSATGLPYSFVTYTRPTAPAPGV